ncbi:hypothetical protein BC828DRAFT_409112 [Blastocladiella britannica]|nr:hypothetical protein BC828DRAFT_409112 [Blastocladiella britannica]
MSQPGVMAFSSSSSAEAFRGTPQINLNLVLVQIVAASIPLCQSIMAISSAATKARGHPQQQLRPELTEVFNLCLEVLTTADGPHAAPLPDREKLTSRSLAPLAFRNVTLKCMTEIAAKDARVLDGNANISADVMYAQLFASTMEVVVVPLEAMDCAKLHGAAVAKAAHQCLVRIARVKDDQLFGTVLDYWAT